MTSLFLSLYLRVFFSITIQFITYHGCIRSNDQVDLKHARSEKAGLNDYDVIEYGIDLKDFYRSVEWDLLAVPARKNEKYYTCCMEPYPDITFNITIRRKTLFHTVNLIIPCVAITFLTVIVFHLPSDR